MASQTQYVLQDYLISIYFCISPFCLVVIPNVTGVSSGGFSEMGAASLLGIRDAFIPPINYVVFTKMIICPEDPIDGHVRVVHIMRLL